MNLHTAQIARAPVALSMSARAIPFNSEDIVLRHLKTPSEIASVLHLRDEIDLSAHAACGAQFAALEKKETSLGSYLPSICTKT